MITPEEIALSHGLCTCDPAYTNRGLTAPDCPWHSMAVEEAMEEYANAKLQGEWVDVNDRLPENNMQHTVLINGDRNVTHQMFYTGGYDSIYKEWLNPFGDRIDERITHWMPLPSPPSQSEPKEGDNKKGEQQ